MAQRILSYQIADSIDIKQFRVDFKGELYYGDSDELFYKMDTEEFIYIFKYGVVCFLNFDAIRISQFLRLITNYCKNRFTEELSEEFDIETNATENKIGYNTIAIKGIDTEKIRLVMLNVSQSVALDYYYEQTSTLLEETNQHTQMLENKGRLSISGTKLKKFIGKTLLLKNRIAENLYIFDSPPETWEDEQLNQIDTELKRTFDLQERFRNIQEGLTIIKDNLELFRDLLQYRHSNMLEWIVIILILVEVINLFIEKFA
ncbi:RMD1 family protein [Desertivirga arenae]|uniref:RMD1 family protein n=1 Tax=Desertivirga arenae TaxID=2810309 RepID=UPI001A96241F|nr:RMD1 family protein [Pedobacter sp. SYSU D00823]